MDKSINMKTHILLIELATRTHGYFISSVEYDIFIQMCQTRSHIATTNQKHLISKIRKK